MLGCNLLYHLHGDDNLINLRGYTSNKWCKLVLMGAFAMTRSLRDTYPVKLILTLTHTIKCGVGAGGRCHVVIAHLLATGSIYADNNTTRHLQNRTLHVCVARDQK